MKTLIKLTLTIGLLLNLSSCKKCDDPCDKRCDNYDPCCGKKPTDAHFAIYEELPYFFSSASQLKQNLTPTDTIVGRNFAVFRADNDAEYYQWKIGGDDREWNTKEMRLRFSSVPFYTPIPITLKVYKPTDASCFPSSSDTAVFTRILYTVPQDSSLLLNKTFKGFTIDEPNIEKVFKYAQGPYRSFPSGSIDTLIPIMPNCIMIHDAHDRHFGYKSVVFRSSWGTQCCLAPSFSGKLKSDNHLWIELEHSASVPTEDNPCEIKWPFESVYIEFNSYF